MIATIRHVLHIGEI